MPRSETDNGAAPVSSMAGDTSVTRSMASMMKHPPGGMSASDVLDQIADRIARKGSGGSGGPPNRKFLGLDLEKMWGKALMALGAVVVWAFTWYMSVNQGLEARPTTRDVSDILKAAFDDHESKPHPATTVKFEKVEADMRKISESQIRQEAYQEQASKALERLNTKLEGINITGANRRRP